MDFKEIEELEEKINESMKLTRQKKEEIDTLENDMFNEVAPLKLEKMKEDLEEKKEFKKEFDEHTIEALVEEAKLIKEKRKLEQKEFIDEVLKVQSEKNEFKRKKNAEIKELKARKEKIFNYIGVFENKEGITEEKIKNERLTAQKVIQELESKIKEANMDLTDNMKSYEDQINKLSVDNKSNLEKLGKHDDTVNKWALELDAEDEIEKARSEIKEDQQNKTEPTKTTQEENENLAEGLDEIKRTNSSAEINDEPTEELPVVSDEGDKPKTAENSNDENMQENGDNENINVNATDANKDGTEQQTGKSDSEKPKTNQTEANDGKALFTTSINRFRTEITTADGKTYTLLTKEMKNVLKAYNKGNKDEMKKEIARISGLDVKDITPDLLDKVDPLILACVSKMENQEKGKENLAKEYLGKYLEALQKNEKDKDMKITYDLNTLSDFFGIKVKDKLKTYERALKSANALDFKDEFKPAPMFRWLTGLRKNNVPKLPAGKPEPQAQPDPQTPVQPNGTEQAQPDPNTKTQTQAEPDNTRENTTQTVEPIKIKEGHENTPNENDEEITSKGDITNDGEGNTVNKDPVVRGEDTKTQTEGKTETQIDGNSSKEQFRRGVRFQPDGLAQRRKPYWRRNIDSGRDR